MVIKVKPEKEVNNDIRIVVLQRGWVLVGRYVQTAEHCSVTDASVVRIWGTTKGLGELAMNGPLATTKLDPTPTAHFHELTVIMMIDCDPSKWSDKLR